VLNQLGMYDAYSGLIIPLVADAAGVFIMKNFFESIPEAVEEAARIDGAGTLRTFWSVVLPMARPALITIFILSFQGSWNELSHFIVASQNPDLFTLTKGVASLASGALGSANQYPVRLGAAVVMTIPVAVLFIIFQKRITNSAAGAVKE
jgi:multiple sugar transport system permease protein